MFVLAPKTLDVAVLIATTRSGRRTGSGRSSIASAKLNIAEVAPMPSASEQIATIVKPGSFRSTLGAWRMDVSMTPLLFQRDSAVKAQLCCHAQAVLKT
jgi:hypothetical protein